MAWLFVSFLSGHFIFWPHYWNQMVAGLSSSILAIASVPVSTLQLSFTCSSKKGVGSLDDFIIIIYKVCMVLWTALLQVSQSSQKGACPLH